MSITLTTSEIGVIRKMPSEERLNALSKLTGDEVVAIELHQSTLQLSGQLMTIIATLEIAIRNSVYNNLSHHFAVTGWLSEPPVPFQWKETEKSHIERAIDSAKRAEYSKLSQVEKVHLDVLAFPKGRPSNISHLKRVKERRKYLAITDGKVIAELTMYFWKRLYGPEYEQSLWRPSLKRTFPDKKITRAQIAIQLETIYQVRNRLAHHEPVLHKRFADALLAIKFVAEHLEEKTANTDSALAKLIATEVTHAQSKADKLHATLASYRK
jgi:hypothetical protein